MAGRCNSRAGSCYNPSAPCALTSMPLSIVAGRINHWPGKHCVAYAGAAAKPNAPMKLAVASAVRRTGHLAHAGRLPRSKNALGNTAGRYSNLKIKRVILAGRVPPTWPGNCPILIKVHTKPFPEMVKGESTGEWQTCCTKGQRGTAGRRLVSLRTSLVRAFTGMVRQR